MQRRFYNVELFNSKKIDALKQYLTEQHHYYETSGCGNGVHFEIRLNSNEFEQVESFIESEIGGI